jgi:hypothetical protein
MMNALASRRTCHVADKMPVMICMSDILC